jgi:hypothetical protein
VKGSKLAAFHHRLFRPSRLPPRIVKAPIYECIEARIALLDAGDRRLDYFDRREIPAANSQRQIGGTHIGGLAGGNHGISAG